MGTDYGVVNTLGLMVHFSPELCARLKELYELLCGPCATTQYEQEMLREILEDDRYSGLVGHIFMPVEHETLSPTYLCVGAPLGDTNESGSRYERHFLDPELLTRLPDLLEAYKPKLLRLAADLDIEEPKLGYYSSAVLMF